MDDIAKEYDVVVLGTGLTECVLSGILSVSGKKVLHVDRNDHYGGEAASVNLEYLFKKYANVSPLLPGQGGAKVSPKQQDERWKVYGRTNSWNIDLVPKLLMANGELTNILNATNVTRYLEFKQIAGSYVQQGHDSSAKIAKVPSDAAEALRSPLMGLFEKRRAKKFLEWVKTFDLNDPSTHAGLNVQTCTMKDVFDKFALEPGTRDFIGHAMALYQSDDEYIQKPGLIMSTIERIRLYVNSMARYGKSPYIYPLYGLGELPQAFARLSAIYGGTYMLNAELNEMKYDEGGRIGGVKITLNDRGDGEKFTFETKCSKIFADPTYFPDKSRKVNTLLKAVCILNHPVAGTENADSLQLIIPQSQIGRKNDIYVAMVSSAHNVCPSGYYIAIVSTISEGNLEPEEQLKAGFQRLGKMEECFLYPPTPIYSPLEDGTKDNIFISKSYDATSHFETTTDDIRDLYKRSEGHDLDIQKLEQSRKG